MHEAAKDTQTHTQNLIHCHYLLTETQISRQRLFFVCLAMVLIYSTTNIVVIIIKIIIITKPQAGKLG